MQIELHHGHLEALQKAPAPSKTSTNSTVATLRANNKAVMDTDTKAKAIECQEEIDVWKGNGRC